MVSDRPLQSRAGDATIVSDADKFWDWFPELSAVLREQIPKADKAAADAAVKALPLQALLHSQRRLLATLAQDPSPSGLRERLSGWVTDAAEGLDNTFPRTGIGTLPGGSDPGSVNTPVITSPEQVTAMRSKLAQLSEGIGSARDRISNATRATPISRS